MKLSYFLRPRPDSKGLCAINLIYRNDGQETYLPTERKVAEKYWNLANRNGTWILSAYGEAQTTFNLALKKLLNDTEDKINRFYLNNGVYPNREQIKRLYAGEKEREQDVFKLFNQFIRYQSRERGVNNVVDGTVGNYTKTADRLRSFNPKLTLSDFDKSFYDKFCAFNTASFGNSGNTTGSYIKIVKTFLKWAQKHAGGAISDEVIESLVIIEDENHFVYLNRTEIDKLIALPLVGELAWVRDAFVLQCLIGCRYSDVSRLIKENVVEENGKKYLRIKTKKNNKHVKVPLSSKAIAILTRYDSFEWIPDITTVNKLIKPICKETGITESTQVVKGSGKFRTESIVPKWSLITTHSAVRSFINNLLCDNVPEHIVATIVGKSIQTLRRYQHVSESDLNDAMVGWEN